VMSTAPSKRSGRNAHTRSSMPAARSILVNHAPETLVNEMDTDATRHAGSRPMAGLTWQGCRLAGVPATTWPQLRSGGRGRQWTSW